MSEPIAGKIIIAASAGCRGGDEGSGDDLRIFGAPAVADGGGVGVVDGGDDEEADDQQRDRRQAGEEGGSCRLDAHPAEDDGDSGQDNAAEDEQGHDCTCLSASNQ